MTKTKAADAAPKVDELKEGEARLVIDDVELVLRGDLTRLVGVSSRLECKSLGDLFARMSNVEAGAVWAGIEFLTVKGDVAAALSKLRLKHFGACGVAFTSILASHFDPAEEA